MSEPGKVVSVIDPSTGKATDLAPAAAQEEFVAGRAQLPLGVKVALTRDGEVLEFDPTKVGEMLKGGWSMADRHQVLDEKAKGQKTQAFLEGAGRALTMGASDLVLGPALGVEGLAERADTASAGWGEGLGIAGQVAGTALTGGAAPAASAAARGAMGKLATKTAAVALAPTRALMAVGDAAATAAGSAATKLGASQVASRIAGQVIGRGVEGAAVGFIGGMSEESLGNPEANAAQLLAAGGMGALVGGGFGAVTGGVFQGLSEGLGRLARGKASPIAASAEGVTQELQRAGIANPDKGLVQAFVDGSIDKMKQAAKFAYDGGNKLAVKAGFNADDIAHVNDSVSQEFIRQGQKGLHEAAEKLGSVMDDIGRQTKLAEHHLPARPSPIELARRLPVEKVSDAVDVAGRHVDEFRAAMHDISSNEELLNLGKGGAKRVLGKAMQAMDEMEDRVFKMAGVDRTYRGTVQTRDALGTAVDTQVNKQRNLREVAGLFELPPEAAAEAYSTLAHVADSLRAVKTANPTIRAEVDELLKSIDGSLGNNQVFGDVADTMKALQVARDARDEAAATMKGKLKFSEAGTVDRGSLASYVKTLTSMEGEDAGAVDAVRKWISAQQEIQNNTLKLTANPRLLQQEAAAIGKPSTLASKFEVAHEALSSRAVTFNTLDRLSRQRQDMLGVGAGPIGYMVGGAVSSLLGPLGTLGAVGGAIAHQAALDPARAAVLRSQSGEAIEKARKAFTTAAGKAMGLPAKALSVDGPRVAKLASTTTRLLDAKTDHDRRDAFRERLAEVAEMNSSEHAIRRNARVMSVGEHMPNTASAMDAKAALAAQLLLASVPAPRMTPGGLQYREPQYSDDAMRRFSRIDRAVQDPNGILERAAEGALSQEDVMVWNTLYPELKEATRTMLMDELGKGHELTRSQEETMMRLTSPDPVARGAHIRRLQGLHRVAPPPGPSKPSTAHSVKAARANLSAADRLAE